MKNINIEIKLNLTIFEILNFIINATETGRKLSSTGRKANHQQTENISTQTKEEKTKIAVKIALVNEIQVYCLPQSTSKVALLPRIITVVLDLIDYRR